MERKVLSISGPELTLENINKFCDVYFQIFENKNDKTLNYKSQKELRKIFEDDLSDYYFVIGEDWLFIYSKIGIYINFLFWGAVNKEDIKNVQTVEMYNFLLNLFKENINMRFRADMIHSTSYQFYLYFLKKGYIKELNHDIEGYNLDFFEFLKFIIINEVANIDRLINSGILNDKINIDKITHEISFALSDKFIQKYGDENELKKCRK